MRSRPPVEMPIELPGETSDSQPTDVKELFCNESLYIFWRLYHYLYDRLRTAKECVLEKAASSRRRTPAVCSDSPLGLPAVALPTIEPLGPGLCGRHAWNFQSEPRNFPRKCWTQAVRYLARLRYVLLQSSRSPSLACPV